MAVAFGMSKLKTSLWPADTPPGPGEVVPESATAPVPVGADMKPSKATVEYLVALKKSCPGIQPADSDFLLNSALAGCSCFEAGKAWSALLIKRMGPPAAETVEAK